MVKCDWHGIPVEERVRSVEHNEFVFLRSDAVALAQTCDSVWVAETVVTAAKQEFPNLKFEVGRYNHITSESRTIFIYGSMWARGARFTIDMIKMLNTVNRNQQISEDD